MIVAFAQLRGFEETVAVDMDIIIYGFCLKLEANESLKFTLKFWKIHTLLEEYSQRGIQGNWRKMSKLEQRQWLAGITKLLEAVIDWPNAQ